MQPHPERMTGGHSMSPEEVQHAHQVIKGCKLTIFFGILYILAAQDLYATVPWLVWIAPVTRS